MYVFNYKIMGGIIRSAIQHFPRLGDFEQEQDLSELLFLYFKSLKSTEFSSLACGNHLSHLVLASHNQQRCGMVGSTSLGLDLNSATNSWLLMLLILSVPLFPHLKNEDTISSS